MLFSAHGIAPSTASGARQLSRAKRPARPFTCLLATALAGGIAFPYAAPAWSEPVNLAQGGWPVPLSSTAPDQVSRPVQAKTYVLGPEDVLSIRLANHPALSSVVTVRPDGKITFPRAGDVQAAGHTTLGLAAKLKSLLERSLNNVRVEVEVKTARPRLARIIGAVKAPGTYDIKSGWRVVDLVAAGGGLTTRAVRINGRVIRGGAIIPLDFPRAMAQPDSIANVPLLPNDLLALDESGVPYQVTVSGKVARPGAYDLEDELTLTKLLAKAGGATDGAALRKAQVLRGGVPIDVDISDNELQNPTSPAARFTLQVGDVVVIPENQARYGIMGQVTRPAYYALPEIGENATILKLLANAGGALPDADLRNATITRTAGEKTEVVTVDLNAMMAGQAPDSQTLRAGDLLFVPRRNTQVTIAGEINRPGTYVLEDKTTIPSLIAQAGNLKTNASQSQAFVMRNGARLPLDLRSFLADGTPNPTAETFRLQPGDVVMIPENQVRYAVLGEVARPGTYAFPEKASDATVLKALTDAGGPTQSGGGGGANLKGASIVRNINGQASVVPVDIAALFKTGAGSNVLLQPGDILFLPAKKGGPSGAQSLLSLLAPFSLIFR